MSELLAEAGVMETPGQPRRANEWVLRDWAITDGVKSTTRYRKGIPGRRGGAGRSHNNGGRGHHHSNIRSHNSQSNRASSGRKGGLSASRVKAAASREKLRLQQRYSARYSAVHEMHLPSSYHAVPSYYERYSGDYSQGLKEETAAGPSMDGGDMLFPSHGMMAAGLATDNSQPYYQNYVTTPASHAAFPPYQGQHATQHQHQHPQQHQHRTPVFKVEQATNVFEPPASGAGGLGLGSRSAYHQVYTDDLGNGGASEASVVRPTHLPYSHPGWSDGQQS